MKTIVLLSVGQPSTNPRLVKEANVLHEAGYKVFVIYSFWNKWASDTDKKIFEHSPWTAILVGGSSTDNKLLYFFTRLRNKLARFLAKNVTFKFGLAEIALGRTYPELLKKAKNIRADLYIAHIQAALPAAVNAAKKNHAKCAFDAEDFHRHETSDDVNNADVILKSKIEDKYFPQLNYLTTSSPQIADAYRKIYSHTKPAVLLNVFPKSIIKQKEDIQDHPIKLFWFSQTIGPNRGIIDVINAMQFLNKGQFELHLLGDKQYSNKTFINELTNNDIKIKFYSPIHADLLVEFAAQFDIGLALEPGFSINNNLALSNKIFTYMQAGLAIIVSDTLAQQSFITENPTIGQVYPKANASALADILLNFQKNRTYLTDCKNESLRLAHTKYNWETESIKFLDIVKQTLDD